MHDASGPQLAKACRGAIATRPVERILPLCGRRRGPSMNDIQCRSPPAARHVWSAESVTVDDWRGAGRGMYPGLSIDWPQPRRAWLRNGAFAGAQIAELAGTPMRIAGRRSPAGNDDTYDLVLQLTGSSHRLDAG